MDLNIKIGDTVVIQRAGDVIEEEVLVTNHEIAAILLNISEVLGIQGENPFKVRAYIKASQTIENLTYELSSLKDKSQIAGLPGIGKGIAQKVTELLETGKLKYYEDLKASNYAPLIELLKIPGLGPKHVKLIYDKLGIDTLEGLKDAAEQGKLKKLRGLGAKLEENILRGIRQVKKYKERLPLAFVYPRAQEIFSEMKKLKEVQEIILAGSLRRMRETIADVDILAASGRAEKVMEAFVSLPQTDKVLAKGDTKSTIVTKEGLQVDLRVVRPESFGAASHYFTGSKAHNIRIRALGADKGLKINEYGVFRKDKRIGGNTEEEIFKSVNLPYIPPELREDWGEIEAGQKNQLPSLIDLKQVKGDLHVHSTWSDGKNTIEEMAQAAKARGYQYIAICDHSPAMGITKGLTEERLYRQMKEIEKANSKLKGFKILTGIEVDIKPDGTLDMSHEALKKLDLVLAAVHIKFTQSKAEMTKRIIRAVENPDVSILAHPTGRLIGKREPYEADMDKIMDACKANAKLLELNAYPERLDLSDVNCRKAKEKGVKIAISTDAHMDVHLDWMKFGIATARRGWLEPQDVVNTLGLSRLTKSLGH